MAPDGQGSVGKRGGWSPPSVRTTRRLDETMTLVDSGRLPKLDDRQLRPVLVWRDHESERSCHLSPQGLARVVAT